MKIELYAGPLAMAVKAMSATSSPRRRPFGQPLHLPAVVSPPRPLRRLPPCPKGDRPGGGVDAEDVRNEDGNQIRSSRRNEAGPEHGIDQHRRFRRRGVLGVFARVVGGKVAIVIVLILNCHQQLIEEGIAKAIQLDPRTGIGVIADRVPQRDPLAADRGVNSQAVRAPVKASVSRRLAIGI